MDILKFMLRGATFEGLVLEDFTVPDQDRIERVQDRED